MKKLNDDKEDMSVKDRPPRRTWTRSRTRTSTMLRVMT